MTRRGMWALVPLTAMLFWTPLALAQENATTATPSPAGQGETAAPTGGAPNSAPIAAQTATGEAVLLHPNGRWVYVNREKAVAAEKVAAQYPENQTRPEGAQGGLFGIGRYIMPGEKGYNRGSLSGK